MLHHLTAKGADYARLHEHVDGTRVRTVSQVRARAREVAQAVADADELAAGILDPTKAPYHADPTGQRDATDPLRRALDDARDCQAVVMLPAGDYRVSGTIEGVQGVVLWDTWPFASLGDPSETEASGEYPCVLRGPHPDMGVGRARLMLADDCPGFNDPAQPRPLLHFWTRWSAEEPDKPRGNTGFGQTLQHLDIDLGYGNAGAVGVRLLGAEYASVEDVVIEARDGFAGLSHLPGSGGFTRRLVVRGGRFGAHGPTCQPSPLLLSCSFAGQTEAAIFFDGRGPLTIVACDFNGSGIVCGDGGRLPWSGNLAVIDSRFDLPPGQPAIRSPRSVYLENCWLRGDPGGLDLAGLPLTLRFPDSPWVQVKTLATTAPSLLPPENTPTRDIVDLSPQQREQPSLVRVVSGARPPDDLLSRHDFPEPPAWNAPGTVFVPPPECAHEDCAPRLQAAIDTGRPVVLGTGTYPLGAPLRLRPGSVLAGLHGTLTTLTSLESEGFANPAWPQPLLEVPPVVPDTHGNQYVHLADLRLCPRGDMPTAYALRWRAGGRSTVRKVFPQRTLWHPDTVAAWHPAILIEEGGVRWLGASLQQFWAQAPTYRHLLARGCREPLSFYHFQPQHAQGLYQTEFTNCAAVEMLSAKSEGNAPVARFARCARVRIIGFGGNFTPFPDGAVFVFDACNDILLAQLNKQRMLASSARQKRWKGHFIFFDFDTPATRQYFTCLEGENRFPVTAMVALVRGGDLSSVLPAKLLSSA